MTADTIAPGGGAADRAALRHYESLDRLSRVMAQARGVEDLIRTTLDAARELFDCDRAWLLFPCDPAAPGFRIVYESARPEYPGALAAGVALPVDAVVAGILREALAAQQPVEYGTHRPHPWSGAPHFDIRSELHVAVRPALGQAWLLGLHQCSRPRRWSANETLLLHECGLRLQDALTNLLHARALAESEAKYRELARERAELLARERDARAEAESASRAKDEFLAVVSHELRTPLTSILAWAQMLRSGRLDPAQTRRALETVERAARTQGRIIDDLLDVSRLRAGKLRLDARPVDPLPPVRAAVDSLRPAAQAKGVRLEASLDGAESGADQWRVMSAPERLQQIVWNLVGNAVKFTPDGGRVDVAMSTGADGCRIEVRDTGPGIPPDFRPRLFAPFSQADASSSRAHGGLGLGLAIVRALVELHGGRVEAQSPCEGGGSTFRVTLATVSAPQAPAGADETIEGARVLLVEDDADTRESLAALLRAHGAEVRTAASAPEALAELARARPDVVVSDLAMPGKDGYWLAEKLAALGPESGGGIPAIALTALAAREDADRALAAGFRRHLGKPVDGAVLAREIRALLPAG